MNTDRAKVERIITTAYQDMEGVMLHKKGYKLRHAVLTDQVMQLLKEALIDELDSFTLVANHWSSDLPTPPREMIDDRIKQLKEGK